MSQEHQKFTDSALSDLCKTFLQSFKDKDGEYKYVNRIDDMLGKQQTWMVLDLPDIYQEKDISRLILSEPENTINALNRAIKETLQVRFPDYANAIENKIKVRLAQFALQSNFEQVNADVIGKIISISGIVLRASQIKPKPEKLCYKCNVGHATFVETPGTEQMISIPVVCDNPQCKERNFTLWGEKSKFVDYQVIRIQEHTEGLAAGHRPLGMDIDMLGSMANFAKPGDRIVLTGIVRLALDKPSQRGKTALGYHIRIEANNIEFVEGKNAVTLTKEDEKALLAMSNQPDIIERLVHSFAPQVKGNEEIKEGLLYAAIGAPAIILDSDTRKRGVIHEFIVGDPGIAKSELLKFVSKIVPRGFYTSGRGNSGVGLTATVVQDRNGLWTLEAGPMVLGDQGLVCIDEFDKMKAEDRGNLHEAMEQECYDDKTEILTENGWKLFRDVKKKEKVASLNDGKLEFVLPTLYVDTKYTGKIFNVKSRQVDLTVTPNHNMYVNINKRANEWNGFELIRMCDLPKKRMRFQKNAKWEGKCIKSFEIPSINKKINKQKSFETGIIKVKMNDWIEFLGYYLAEGSYAHQKGIPYRVTLTQTESVNLKVRRKMISCIKRMNFEPKFYGNNITINSKQLATYVKQFGHAHEKFIPNEIMKLCSEQLGIMYNALMEGDGHTNKIGHEVYITSSNLLADNFQELCLKLKKSANKRIVRNKGEKIRVPDNRTSIASNNIYELSVIREKQCFPNINYSGKFNHVKEEEYDGRIYCVEVPNHVIYVRRNGIPVWCGNTISIAKGGIIATLNSRTTVIAAANPIHGKYNPMDDLYANLKEIPIALLTRFDLIFIVKDIPDKVRDTEIAKHIVSLYSTKKMRAVTIESELLTKYIILAKKIDVSLPDDDELGKIIVDYYVKIRTSSDPTQITITPRQLEGIIRLSMARARTRLNQTVEEEDIHRAIEIFENRLKEIGVDPASGKVDFGILEGHPKSIIEKQKLWEDILKTIEGFPEFPTKELVDKMLETGKWDESTAQLWLREKFNAGSIITTKPGFVRVQK